MGCPCLQVYLLGAGLLRSVQQETRTDRFYFKISYHKVNLKRAAQYLDDCSPSHLQEQLDNIFGRKYLFNEINGVILYQNFLITLPIITTNYDNILSTVYQKWITHFLMN